MKKFAFFAFCIDETSVKHAHYRWLESFFKMHWNECLRPDTGICFFKLPEHEDAMQKFIQVCNQNKFPFCYTEITPDADVFGSFLFDDVAKKMREYGISVRNINPK